MTAQEAQTTLGIEPPFSTVELKSAHKNALVTWFPAQFMSDRAKLSKALEQTARIHEAYDLLLPLCEAEERKNANPWLDDALKQAYGQAPAGASAPDPAALPEVTPDGSPSPESPRPGSPEPPAREDSSRASRDVFAAWEKETAAAFVPAPPRTSGKDAKREPVAKAQPALDTDVPTLDKDAEPVTADSAKPTESTASPTSTPANPFLHDIVSLKKGTEGPKVELRGNSAAPVGQATSSPSVSAAPSTPSASPEGGVDSGSTVAPRMDTAITKVRPPKVVISPRLQGASVRPAMPVVTVPVPLPPLAAPAPVAKVAPMPPESAPVAEAPAALPAPVTVAEIPEAPLAPAPVAEAPAALLASAAVAEESAVQPASAPVAETPVEPIAAEVPAPVDEPSLVEDKPAVVAEIPPAVSPALAPEAAPTPAPASTPAPESAHAVPVSATVAEEASAVEQASHHVHAAAATPAVDHTVVPAAIPAPKLKSKPKPATGQDGESETDEERAGDHALVPALGDRYHPAEKEGSPNTDTSRHFPTRPVAPSQAVDESEDTASVAEDNVAGIAASPGRVRLSAWQRIYRFVLGGVCVVGVGYGIYWVSQSDIGRDPWGFEPGSGGPSDRIRQMAFEGLKQGAENGNVNAQLTLGRAYQKGESVEANPEEALKWFRKAAENGSVDAQYAVGDAYKSGSGVPQDNAEALKWYRMAEATREGQRTEEPKEKEEDVRLQ
ncbi:tetratricopeptide repeat protein [Roseimicrobium sp. ORNL1]|uniref:tetratricopeptide repeat protein n=1 Tax=Roseimicrobium sp. ORNL1 TaxID=2711231 RepID=UPI0013E1EF06|nr:tetratricopeptide repeat protein [Roseimicrobium sp. ORNL1]QIF03465.1 hypothetical protein G5S37_18675 [Roseimicrobium sp. ORNL1]